MVKSVFTGSPHFNMKKSFGSPDPNIFLSAIAIFSCIRGLLEQNGVSRDLYVDFCLAVSVPMALKSFDLQDGERYITTFGKRYRHVYKYWQIKPLSTPQLLLNYILFYKIFKNIHMWPLFYDLNWKSSLSLGPAHIMRKTKYLG